MSKLSFLDMGVNGTLVGELNQVIFTALVDPQAIGAIFDVQKGVATGDKVTRIGEFGLVGKMASGCNTDWDTADIVDAKSWLLGDFSADVALCWANIPAPFKRRLSNADGANTQRNEFVDKVLRPRLETAIRKMYLRLAFFADTRELSAIASDLKDAENAVYFKSPFKGIFGQLADIVATHPEQLVTVDANTEDTREEQKEAMYVAGVPMGIIDNLITNANPALRTVEDGVIYMTLAMADALEWDIKHSNKGSDLQWEAIKYGVKVTQYNGIKVVVIPALDEIINLYDESVASPYRAIYTSYSNMQFATQGEEEIAELTIEYSAESKNLLMSALDHFGASIVQNDLFVLAM